MTHVFTCKEHKEFGVNGWVLNAKPYFDPGDGNLVAHDILEEFPNGKDQPHDELMALGAYMFGRGSMYDNPYHSLGENVASEFVSFYQHIAWEDGYALAPAPIVRPLSAYHYGDSEDHIIEVGRKAPDLIEAEYGDEPDRTKLESLKAWVPDALNWLRIGYRRAHRRYYPHMNGPDVSYMFERIKREANKALKGAEIGAELSIRVSYRCNELTTWCREPWEVKGYVW